MGIKMIITDLDGTLLCSDGNISQNTKVILKNCQNHGIFVIIATARYWIGAEQYIEEIQPDYEITADGTLIHQHQKQIYSYSLSVEATNQIIQDLLVKKPGTEITVVAGRLVFRNSQRIPESEKLHKAVYNDYQRPLSCQANKIIAWLSDYKIALEIANKNNCHLQSYREENWYAFLPKNAGKVQAIRELTRILNISLSDIVAFGDDKNDMEMLQICGIGVAVANAVQEVKLVADCVTLTNDEDGVAEWLSKNVLID